MLVKKILKSKLIISLVAILIAAKILNSIFTYNVTPSIQKGLYIRNFSNRPLKKGDVVLETVPFDPSVKVADEKRLKSLGVIKNGQISKLKIVAGTTGDTLHLIGNHIYVNSEDYGEIFNFGGKDYVTLFKNKYDNYKLKQGEYIALSKRSQSYDGRYVDEGVQNISNIKGRYTLFYISKSDLGYCYEINDAKTNSDKMCKLVKRYVNHY